MTSDAEIKTASWSQYQLVEQAFRDAVAVEPKTAAEKNAHLIALAIRAGATEIACEIKSARYAKKAGA